MVHAAVAEAEPGEVLVADDARAEPGRARRRAARDAGEGARRRSGSRRRRGSRRRGAARARAADLGALRARRAEPTRRLPGTIGEPVEVGGATIRQGDVVVLDADGAVVVEQERRRRGPRGRVASARARAREAREAPGRRALVRPRRPAGSSSEAVTEPLHDVARIGHAELLTPKPDESLRFFVDVLGHGGGGARGASRSTCAAGATTCATA